MAKPLDIEQLVRIPSIYPWNGYALAPDGQSAAVVWDKSGQWQIYLVPLRKSGNLRKVELVAASTESQMSPAFSPDGRFIAFAQDYGGDENYDILLYDRASGAVRNLTPNTPDETINPYFSWSPDSQRLAFVSNRDGRFATYTLRADAKQPLRTVKRVTQHDYSDAAADWSPDGRYIAVTALARGQEAWVTLVAPTGAPTGGEEKIVGTPADPMDARQVAWSADGKRLAFTSSTTGLDSIFTFEVDTGELRQVTSGPCEATQPHWSPDPQGAVPGKRLAFAWNEDGNVSVGLKDLATGEMSTVQIAPGAHTLPRFTSDGKHLAFLYNGPQHPNDLWVQLLTTGRTRQLTRSLTKTLTGDEFVAPKLARWSCDGLTISGWLYAPSRKRKPLPAILYIHGGPTAQARNEWAAPIQHLVSQGTVVLAPNYRGSTGYGRAFQEANRFDLGGGDMRDVIAGAEWLVSQGYADPQRIAITGGSYGGYLTMTALTRHPKVFACGSAIVPFLNWFTEYENERADLQYWDRQNMGDPVVNAERFREYSPITYFQDIVAPIQMIAGAHDPRCPASETEQAAALLKDMGVPHDILIYPDEGHGFRKVANRVDAYRRRAEFLARYLG